MAYENALNMPGKAVTRHIATGISMATSDRVPYFADGEKGGGARDGIACAYKNGGSIQITWTGGSHNDGSIQVQVSNDRENWSDVSGAAVTMNPGSGGSDVIRLSNIEEEFIALNYTKGSNTTGTFEVRIILKSRH